MFEKLRKKTPRRETFVQSIFVLMMSQVMIKLLGLVYKIYLTNKEGFGDTGNAIYNSGYQIYALLLAISSIGIPNAISKIIAEHLAVGDKKGVQKVFKVSMIFFAGIGLISSMLLYFGAYTIANEWLLIPEAELTLKVLAPAIFFVAISSVIRGYFNGHQQMSTTAHSQTLEQMAKTIITIIIVEVVASITSNDVVFMAAAANLATTISIILSFVYLIKYYIYRKNKKNDERIDITTNTQRKSIREIIKNVIKISLPMTLSSLVSSINKNIDSVTAIRGLKNFMSEVEAKFQFGIYTGKVDTLVGLPLSFNIAFATVLVPTIAKLLTKDRKEEAVKTVESSLLSTILIALPCTFGMIIFAQPILNLLFPNATSGATLLQITSVTILFMSLAQTINGALQGIGKYRVPAIALTCGVVVKLFLNLILIPIPEIGINGVAISAIVCHIISFSIGFAVLRRTLKIRFNIVRFIIKPIISTGIMCLSSYCVYVILQTYILEQVATVVALAFAFISYFFIVFSFRILNKEEILNLPKGKQIYELLIKFKLYKE